GGTWTARTPHEHRRFPHRSNAVRWLKRLFDHPTLEAEWDEAMLQWVEPVGEPAGDRPAEGAGINTAGRLTQSLLDSLRRWEQSRNLPRIDDVFRLAQALDVSLDVLIIAKDMQEVPPQRPRPPRKRDEPDQGEGQPKREGKGKGEGGPGAH